MEAQTDREPRAVYRRTFMAVQLVALAIIGSDHTRTKGYVRKKVKMRLFTRSRLAAKS